LVKEVSISVPDTWTLGPHEGVDAVCSVALKEAHRRFGGWMKKLASLVKKHYTTKGNWQALWTIATRVFGLAYHGHSIDVAKALAGALAPEMNVDAGVAEELTEAIYANLSDIVGEKRARGQAPEGFI